MLICNDSQVLGLTCGRKYDTIVDSGGVICMATKMPSKKQMERDRLHYQAEDMVREGFMQSEEGKRQVKIAVQELNKAHKKVVKGIAKRRK